MDNETRDHIARQITATLHFDTPDVPVMRVIQSCGATGLPRDARELSFASQDYYRETPASDRDAHALIDHMLTAERRPEWPL